MRSNYFKSIFSDKKVLILGLGLHGGGVGAASFFVRAGAKVVVTDLKSRKELAPSLLQLRGFKSISYILGRHRKSDLLTTDFIVKNPGVPDGSPLLKIAEKTGVPVLSDIEIFFKYCPAKTIGVTGTKGKSTTAALLTRFLRAGVKKRVWLAGNIRKSVLEILPKISKEDLVVLELSSFQLDSLSKSHASPHIAVITNIFPDHLNRYQNFKSYANSKAAIFRYQRKGDFLFLPLNDTFLKKLSSGAKSRKVFVNTDHLLRPHIATISKNFLVHQFPSISLAISVSKNFKVSAAVIKKVLSGAKQLSGRLEMVRTVKGVTFINDTTATNPGAAIAALHAVSKKSRGGIILIAGGSDKKLPVDDLARAIRKLTKAVVLLPGWATNKIKAKIRNSKFKTPEIVETKTMHEAVRMAYANAKGGDTVLLSPGAASFGLFQNEFDRGDQFINAVRGLK